MHQTACSVERGSRDIRNRSRRLPDRNPPRSNIETNESRTGKIVEDKLELASDDYGLVIVELPTVIISYYFLRIRMGTN